MAPSKRPRPSTNYLAARGILSLIGTCSHFSRFVNEKLWPKPKARLHAARSFNCTKNFVKEKLICCSPLFLCLILCNKLRVDSFSIGQVAQYHNWRAICAENLPTTLAQAYRLWLVSNGAIDSQEREKTRLRISAIIFISFFFLNLRAHISRRRLLNACSRASLSSPFSSSHVLLSDKDHR
jgi:hypothetical protein